MTVLISEYRQIFSASSVDRLGVPADSPSLDWITKESGGGSPWENSISGPLCLPSVGPPSPLKAPVVEPPRQGSCSQAAVIPGTREQTSSPGKHSFGQPGTKSSSPQSSAENPSLPCGGNWLWNGLCSLHSHRRAPLKGQVRDSSSSHRLSIYDNVPTAGLSLGTPSSTGTSWDGSLARESLSSCAACRASSSSALSSLQMEWAVRGSVPQSIGYLENSTERSDTCFGSSNSSEPKGLSAASRDSVACSGALQGLVVELKAELSKQRIGYEASIQR